MRFGYNGNLQQSSVEQFNKQVVMGHYENGGFPVPTLTTRKNTQVSDNDTKYMFFFCFNLSVLLFLKHM